ncbi:MAG: GAF domain-containing protein [Coleofasciculus chthonoplastes F3-SA18-01]|uniref:GAF domain-containing protein n=1 Tax=Coleofasciculus chthonoplastes TaxID=64178 RepID=UPI0032FBE831
MVLAEFFIPHGHCYLWKPELVGLHLISDFFTALAYYSIPLTLTYFVTKRSDVPFNWIFLLFSGFIIACGTTHIMEIWTLWHPNYWLSGWIKAVTALISVVTAGELVRLLPQALTIPSTAQLEAEIKKRQKAQAELWQEKTHLAQAQSVAHVGSWEFDLATQDITWSDETFRIYGLSPGQPTPTIREHRQTIHAKDRKAWKKTVHQLVRGKSCQLEFRILRPDGFIRHLFAQGEPIFNAQGQVHKLFGTLLDISDRVAAQQRERLFGAIALRIHQSLELDEILDTTVTEVRQFLETDRVLIYRFNPDWSGQIVVESAGEPWTAVLNTTLDDPCFGKDYAQLYQQGRVRAIANIYTAGLQPCHLQLLEPFQVIANLVVPILLGDKLWGLLIVHHCRSQRHWQSYEIELLQQLATQVAIALQQSELYSKVQAELIERQRIEKELRVSEQRYRSVVTAMSEGILLQQADGQIIACNVSAENILGRSAQQILGQIGMNWRGQIIQEDGSPFPSQDHPAMVTLSTGKPQCQVIMGISPPEASLLSDSVDDSHLPESRAKGGGLRLKQKEPVYQEQRKHITWISINSQPLFHPGDSQPYAVVTSFSDITQSKRSQEALHLITQQERERALQLEQALQKLQRTQAQLVQNEKMVSLGQLVAGVAHEINNPTSFIYGNIPPASDYAQDLLHLVQLYGKHYPKPVAEIAEYIDEIDLDFITTDFPKLLASMQEGARRISEIVQSLRHFSRLDEADCKRVNLHQGIDSTLLILKHRLTQQGNRPEIKLVKDYGQLPLVKCYPGQLNQVFMNIISNAIDALDEDHNTAHLSGIPSADRGNCHDYSTTNPQPSPLIRIHTEFIEPNWVIIRIADNGTGIKAEVQSRIFDPFFTTKPVGQGTGLGLSISYQIVVDKHGGQLQCHSHPPQGTEFVIKLPVNKS